jgi:carbonic anhydrase/acetyltransferase-like protein (isoleucine patch superfamily)
MILKEFLNKISNLNPLAEIFLNRKCQKEKMFICRGKIQLSLASTATLKPPEHITYIGQTLLGEGTPRDLTTVVAVSSDGCLFLNGARLGRGTSILVGTSAFLHIDQNSYIADGTRISAQNSISIGKDCAISWGVTIIDDDGHGFGPPPYSAPIIIEDNVWVGCNATILKGVTIGTGSVVAAGAVVTRSCPPYSLIGGVPARVIRQDIHWTDQSRQT